MFCLNNLISFHLDRVRAYSLACYNNTATTFAKTVTAFMQVTQNGKKISSTHSAEGTNMIITKFSLEKGSFQYLHLLKNQNPPLPSSLHVDTSAYTFVRLYIYICTQTYIYMHRAVLRLLDKSSYFFS